MKKILLKNREIIFLGFLFFFSFFSLSSLLAPGFAYGDDNTAHYVFTVRLADMLKNGNLRLWDPDQNLGFPMLYYYQLIPYLATSILYILIPFVSSLLIYKFLIIVLFSFFPLSIYCGARWMNISKKIALTAACFSLLINSKHNLGLEISSYLIWGFFTMLFGMILFPLAVGYTYREYFGKRRLFAPVLLLSLTLLSHSFIGIAANLSIAVLIFFSPKNFSLKQKKADILYIVKIVLLEFIAVSFWIVPLLTSLDYYGGHPFESKETMLGYGFKTMTRELFIGDFFDSKRLPVLTSFLFLGIIACLKTLLTARGKKPEVKKIIAPKNALYLTSNFILFLIFLTVPSSLDILKFFPGVGIIQFSRFWTGLHLFGIMIAAIGVWLFLQWVHSFLSNCMHDKKRVIFILLVLGITLFLYLLIGQYFVFRTQAKTFAFEKEDPAYLEVLHALAAQPEGRVQVNGVTGIETHWRLYTPPLYAKKPVVISYAVGLQDSLGFYYVETLKDFNPAILDLFNIKYIIEAKYKNHSFLGTRLFSNKKYNIYKTNSTGYFDLIRTNTVILAKNKKVRDLIIKWARSKALEEGNFLTIGEGRKIGFFKGRGYQNFIALGEAMNESFDISRYLKLSAVEKEACGEILREEVDIGEYTATVRGIGKDTSCYVMVKVNAHRDWKVFVDGNEKEWVEVSPSFMAVPILIGEHEVKFVFSLNILRKLLFLFAILTFGAIWYYEKRKFCII